MTEATSTLWVEMKMRDLTTKALKTSSKGLATFGKLGIKTFKALGRGVRDFARFSIRQITKFTSSATRKFKALAKLGAIGFGVAAVGFGAAFLKSAIEFEESASKFQAVFGDLSAGAAENVKKIREETGTSIVALTKFFGDLQDTFVPMGIAADEAAELSSAVTRLAIDVASFQNKATSDVIDDFSSALVGSSETVKKYGIIINEARIKEEAYRLGLVRGNEELTIQAKLQARISILFQDTTKAQGDAVRTLDSTANVFRRLRENYEELKVVFGREISIRIIAVIDALGGIEGVTKKAAIAFSALTGATSAALFVFEKFGGVIGSLTSGLGDVSGLTSLLSGRFFRLRSEAVALAQQTEADFKKLGGVLPEGRPGLAEQVVAPYDQVFDDFIARVKEKLTFLFPFLASIASAGARLIAQNIKLGFLEVFDGFELTFNSKYIDDIKFDFTTQIADTKTGLGDLHDEIDTGFEGIELLYDGFITAIQIANNDINKLIGSSDDDLLGALIPDASAASAATETYRRTGREWGAALGESFREGASSYFSQIVPPGAKAELERGLRELGAVSIAAANVAQQAALSVVSSPQSLLAYFALGASQFSAIEQGILAGMSTSQIPSQMDQFVAQQNERLKQEAFAAFKAGGGDISTAEGQVQFLSDLQALETAFFNTGEAARGGFVFGIQDAGAALGTLSEQVNDAAQGIVFGLQSSLSTGFEAFITGAADAGHAWVLFRDQFNQTLAQIASDLIASNLTAKITALFGGGAEKDDSGAAAAAAATLAATTAVSASASAAISAAQATLAAKAAAFAAFLAAKLAAKFAISSIGGTTGVDNALGGVIHSDVGTPSRPRAFAAGGVTNGPTLALFGERQKEAFVPLPNNGHIPVEIKGGSGGGDVNISIPVNALDPSTAADVIRSQMPLIAGDIAAMIQGNGHRELRVAITEAR